MFDDYVRPALPDERQLLPSRADAGLRTAAEDSAKYVGLCVNCEHRTTCRYPKPEGGLWHCEDYA
jgi:hypothetical protein